VPVLSRLEYLLPPFIGQSLLFVIRPPSSNKI